MNTQTLFHAAHSVALPAEGGVPERIHLIPAGEFCGRDGRGPYRLDADAVLAAFAAQAVAIPIDYEHQSIHTADNGQPAPAAGWIEALEARADGLWGKVVWTDRARAYLTGHEYRYLSPVFEHFADGRVIALDSVALVNQPNLTLTALNRRQDPLSPSPEGASKMTQQNSEAAKADDLKTLAAAPQFAAMKKALTLGDAAPLEDVFVAVNARLAELTLLKSEHARIAALYNAEQALKKKAAEDTAIEAAKAAHKISPASEESSRLMYRASPDAFAKFIESQPVILPGAQTSSHTQEQPPKAESKNPLLADAEARSQRVLS
ncbi:MAG: phage protease [Zoogloeaceae bacterium]|jgi:phage I-like protein|nr:phage protease [Zoogloeaceae bacterium]